MQHIRILLLVSLWTHFISPNHLLGQIKYEKEYDIEQKEVPRIALEFITKSGFEKHVRWYREESQDGTTIEAKSKKNRHKYSIEFDTSGKLLDIEKTVKIKQLSPPIQSALREGLTKEFRKYKVIKIQEQWKGDQSELLESIQSTKASASTKINYELIIKGKINDKKEYHEVLMSPFGQVFSRSLITHRTTDNLEF